MRDRADLFQEMAPEIGKGLMALVPAMRDDLEMKLSTEQSTIFVV